MERSYWIGAIILFSIIFFAIGISQGKSSARKKYCLTDDKKLGEKDKTGKCVTLPEKLSA